ncbi:chemotaxis protein CheA [Anoxybacterium hadale]|uniref:Chemotaxis protein CheA n=1 Tax=Anoxybacterium hadale TaxID=3408580 RepID=A0ACD1ACH1_9FIRM|nr:chemotaxis protein CheA [Clostridiales bacterium]
MSDYDFANDSMLEMYLFESTTLLDQLDEILLQSEKAANLSTENVNEIFRIMHTIKGSSAMMEFDTISLVSHKLEDLFYIIRDNGLDDAYFQELFDLVLRVSDFLKEEVETIQNGMKPSSDNEGLISEILDLIDRMNGNGPAVKDEIVPAPKAKASKAKTADASVPSSSKDSTAPQAASVQSEGNVTASGSIQAAAETSSPSVASSNSKVYHLHVNFTADCQMENIRAFMLVNKLETIGKVIATIPEELNTNKDASSIISQNGFYCSIETSLPQEQITAMTKGTLSVYTVEFISALPNAAAKVEAKSVSTSSAAVEATPVASSGSDPEAVKSAPSGTDPSGDNGKGKAGKQNLINVDLNKLDTLMDLVGEIVITESMVSGSSDLAGLELDNFNRAARQLRKLTDELQDIVMSIRMVPIASTFQKMRRIVRDMGKKLDKDVDLVLMGEATEVDKTIIDGIADPLMHLVRNAMDHAIEDKDSRAAAKKDPVGRIILSAQNIGGDIIISVSDDGKGLDAEMILEKAKAKNLLTKPESDYTEKEIFNLLTMPGFSTKEAVTEFSGRGVGMDVVKKNIEKIGGTVTIESVKGNGTNIFFKIPLTLAIIASMEIKVGSNVYAIPINNIRESFKATQKQLLTDPDGNEMIMIRGVCYPIIRLHKIFHLQDAQTNLTDGILLLVDSGDRLACILADELLGKHQVVVKPLPVYLSRYAAKGVGIAGCTILGDGSISLILDVQGILNQY